MTMDERIEMAEGPGRERLREYRERESGEPIDWVLHQETREGEWNGCEYPERPPDDRCRLDLFCPRCFTKLEAKARAGGFTALCEPGREPVLVYASELLAEHVRKHGDPRVP